MVHLRTNFNEILIEIPTFSFRKIHLTMSSGRWWPFCRGLNVLISVLGNRATMTGEWNIILQKEHVWTLPALGVKTWYACWWPAEMPTLPSGNTEHLSLRYRFWLQNTERNFAIPWNTDLGCRIQSTNHTRYFVKQIFSLQWNECKS